MDATRALNQHDYARYANIMDKWHDATGVPRDGDGKGGSTQKSEEEGGGGSARKAPNWADITGEVIKGESTGGGSSGASNKKSGKEETSSSPDEGGGGSASKTPDWADITGEVIKGEDAAMDPSMLNSNVEANTKQQKKDQKDLDQES